MAWHFTVGALSWYVCWLLVTTRSGGIPGSLTLAKNVLFSFERIVASWWVEIGFCCDYWHSHDVSCHKQRSKKERIHFKVLSSSIKKEIYAGDNWWRYIRLFNSELFSLSLTHKHLEKERFSDKWASVKLSLPFLALLYKLPLNVDQSYWALQKTNYLLFCHQTSKLQETFTSFSSQTCQARKAQNPLVHL